MTTEMTGQMKAAVVVGAPCLALFLCAPLIVAVLIVSFSEAAADCKDTRPATTTGTTPATDRVGGPDALAQVRLGGTGPMLTAEQAGNATLIASIVRDELDLSARALEIAIATALQESSLVNLDHGDRDSAGLFQQRPSTGWGTHEQVTDPRLATLAFLGIATHTANPGLLDIPGWQTVPLAEAAQRVQRSAFPDAYAKWEPVARQITDLLDQPSTDARLAATPCDRTGRVAFIIGSLNLLGAGHTTGPDARPGYAGWEARLPRAMDALRASGATVAGLQEVHDPQQVALDRDPRWDVFPRRGKQNVVVWDPTVWTMSDARLIKIPYFGGEPTPMPLVELTRTGSDATGSDTPEGPQPQRIWVWSIHNPADVAGDARRHRIEGLRRQVATLQPLVDAGAQVFIVGDFNDAGDGPERAHCQLTPQFANAFDATTSRPDAESQQADRCRPPSGDAEVDHIFGANITFAGAEVDRTVQRTKVSDHPLVLAHIASHTVSADACPTTTSPAERGLTPDALLVLRCVNAIFGPHVYGGVGNRAANPESDHPAGRAVDVMIDDWTTPSGVADGTRIADWIREHADELGVTYVIWRSRTWSTTRADEGWRPYRHPSGAGDPTSAHLDHIHVSVHGTAGTGLTPAADGSIVYPVPRSFIDTDARNWHDSGPSWSRWHSGTDFSAPCGTPVLAAHAGAIQLDRTHRWAGRWLVKVITGPGSLTTWYAHLHSLIVDDGDVVRPGQQIGTIGGDQPVDGNSTGCHLHFEVHLSDGDIYGLDNVDPTRWLAQHATAHQA